MKFPLLTKLGALLAVIVVLVLGLNAIEQTVRERQMRQREAQRNVADSLAGAQTVLGPVLQRRCTEAWMREDGEGKDRRNVAEQRQFVATAWPRTLAVTASAGIEPLKRGLFRVNSFLAKMQIQADWSDLSPLQPVAQNVGGRVQCEAPTVAVALSDARGIQAATLRMGTDSLTVRPGSLLPGRDAGFHAALAEAALAGPLRIDITLDVAGSEALAFVPVGDETRVKLASNWAHPSFGGRFLPVERQIGAQGFSAQWQVSALATTAQQALGGGNGDGTGKGAAGLCDRRDIDPPVLAGTDGRARPCVDSFGVGFIDPVNAYVLSDRAIKYGLLFIVLTFVGVMLVEVTRRLRVHPVQYLLVGCALTLFFLMLVSLSEHIAFAWAYLCASFACSALLTYYALHVLRGLRAGLVFGAAVAALYGALYALLQMEQTAMVLGSALLFTVLTAVMVATRRLDWYGLASQMREQPVAATSTGNSQ
jgi:inner membrane protein